MKSGATPITVEILQQQSRLAAYRKVREMVAHDMKCGYKSKVYWLNKLDALIREEEKK